MCNRVHVQAFPLGRFQWMGSPEAIDFIGSLQVFDVITFSEVLFMSSQNFWCTNLSLLALVVAQRTRWCLSPD